MIRHAVEIPAYGVADCSTKILKLLFWHKSKFDSSVMHHNQFHPVRFEWAAEVGRNAVFKEPTDEDKICQVLKAFMEEWGTENVVVSLPKDWQQYSRIENIAGVRFEFCTQASIAIRVQCDNVVAAHYECELSC